MSVVKSHPSGQNFFMVIVRFLETFVGSMSSGWFYKSYLMFFLYSVLLDELPVLLALKIG